MPQVTSQAYESPKPFSPGAAARWGLSRWMIDTRFPWPQQKAVRSEEQGAAGGDFNQGGRWGGKEGGGRRGHGTEL